VTQYQTYKTTDPTRPIFLGLVLRPACRDLGSACSGGRFLIYS
jgi:hypothetical protein